MKLQDSKLLILLLLVSLKCYGQKNISEILTNDVLPADKIAWIYDLDVFRFYYEELKVNERYNTPLQRQIYAKTEDYNKKLNELEKLKSALGNKSFYLKLTSVERFGGYRNDHKYNVKQITISNYDINTKGFELQLGMNYLEHRTIKGTAAYEKEETSGAKAFPLIMREDFKYDESKIYINSDYAFLLLKELPLLKRPPISQYKTPDEFLFIPVDDENSASEIETYKNRDIELYLFFRPVNKEIIESYHNWDKYNDIFITASDEVRLVLINKKNGKIYFDKTYVKGANEK